MRGCSGRLVLMDYRPPYVKGEISGYEEIATDEVRSVEGHEHDDILY